MQENKRKFQEDVTWFRNLKLKTSSSSSQTDDLLFFSTLPTTLFHEIILYVCDLCDFFFSKINMYSQSEKREIILWLITFAKPILNNFTPEQKNALVFCLFSEPLTLQQFRQAYFSIEFKLCEYVNIFTNREIFHFVIRNNLIDIEKFFISAIQNNQIEHVKILIDEFKITGDEIYKYIMKIGILSINLTQILLYLLENAIFPSQKEKTQCLNNLLVNLFSIIETDSDVEQILTLQNKLCLAPYLPERFVQERVWTFSEEIINMVDKMKPHEFMLVIQSIKHHQHSFDLICKDLSIFYYPVENIWRFKTILRECYPDEKLTTQTIFQILKDFFQYNNQKACVTYLINLYLKRETDQEKKTTFVNWLVNHLDIQQSWFSEVVNILRCYTKYF